MKAETSAPGSDTELEKSEKKEEAGNAVRKEGEAAGQAVADAQPVSGDAGAGDKGTEAGSGAKLKVDRAAVKKKGVAAKVGTGSTGSVRVGVKGNGKAKAAKRVSGKGKLGAARSSGGAGSGVRAGSAVKKPRIVTPKVSTSKREQHFIAVSDEIRKAVRVESTKYMLTQIEYMNHLVGSGGEGIAELKKTYESFKKSK